MGGNGAAGVSWTGGAGGYGTSLYSNLLFAANAGVESGGLRYIASGGSGGGNTASGAVRPGGGGYRSDGLPNTGGGAGGVNSDIRYGGSGIVIVRYLKPRGRIFSVSGIAIGA
jgi:hypothetical protein